MSSKKIVTHCSPTLAGIKTANLFGEKYKDSKEIINQIKEFNTYFKNKNLKMIPISLKNNRALIYMYREDRLLKDLNNNIAKDILKDLGYDLTNTYKSLKRLSERINESEGFPHEIGLFLGYPPLDVLGFILNDAKNFKYVGFWKVYDNLEEALKTFDTYKKCSKCYQNKLLKGCSLENLIVS